MSDHSESPQLQFPLETESIAIPLGLRQWLVVIGLAVAIVVAIPRVWKRQEQFDPHESWRMPVALTEDYWQWNRWLEETQEQGRIPMLGDSVVWGEFARPTETLSMQLSGVANENGTTASFANLGLKGLYPIAMERLVDRYSPKHCAVVLFNPIWMTSPRRDLQESNPDGMNHSLLVPQWSSPPAYQATFEERISRSMNLRLDSWQWRQHWRLDDLEGKDWATWSMRHPHLMPWQATDCSVREPEDEPQSQVPNAASRNVARTSTLRTYEWVDVGSSLQWDAFERMLVKLSQRGVAVSVLVTSLDPSGRTEACVSREYELVDQVMARVVGTGATAIRIAPQPAWMADASHPTPDGYRAQATLLWSDSEFRSWVMQQCLHLEDQK